MGKYIKTRHDKLKEQNKLKGNQPLQGYSMIDAGTSFVVGLVEKIIDFFMFFYNIENKKVYIPQSWRDKDE